MITHVQDGGDVHDGDAVHDGDDDDDDHYDALAPSFPPVDSSDVDICHFLSITKDSLYILHFPLFQPPNTLECSQPKLKHQPTCLTMNNDIDMVKVRSGHLFESFSFQLDNLEGEIGSKSRPIKPVKIVFF